MREAKGLQSKQFGVLKGDHAPDEASGIELELQANPVASYQASDAAQEEIKAELAEWFAANGKRAFDRYDLDCSGTSFNSQKFACTLILRSLIWVFNSGDINTAAELEQLSLCVFSLMMSASDTTKVKAKYQRVLTPEKITNEINEYAQVQGGVKLSFDQFQRWFYGLLQVDVSM